MGDVEDPLSNLHDSLARAVREYNLALERGDEATADLLKAAISQLQAALRVAAEEPS